MGRLTQNITNITTSHLVPDPTCPLHNTRPRKWNNRISYDSQTQIANFYCCFVAFFVFLWWWGGGGAWERVDTLIHEHWYSFNALVQVHEYI